MPRITQLYNYHVSHARMVEFAGFSMPLFYSGIVEEHTSVRESCGIFDVSHMGRIYIKGPDATRFLQNVLPTNVEKHSPGKAFYSLLLNDEGGIKDDLITYKVGEDEYLLVVNAVNREKDLSWLKLRSSGFDVEIENISDSTGMMALQGPNSSKILQELLSTDPGLKRFTHRMSEWKGNQIFVARTGYTGEDGFELIIMNSPIERPDNTLKLWNKIIDSGVKPCGLGARDTLRIEAGFCLYENDINESTTPLEAALDWVVDFEKPFFVGRERLLAIRNRPPRRRIGLLMVSAGIPRHGYLIMRENIGVGIVTSGTFSPILKKGIAMGYLPPDMARIGTRANIMLRSKVGEAVVHGFPFYDETRYGWKRKMVH